MHGGRDAGGEVAGMGAQGLQGRAPGVEHGLLPRGGPPPRGETADPGLQGARERLGVEHLQAGHGAPGAQEEGAVQGPGGAADGGDQGGADLLEQGVGAGEAAGLHRLGGGGQAALHVGAVVGVADGGVQVGELLGVLGDECGAAAHPGSQVRHAQRVAGGSHLCGHVASPYSLLGVPAGDRAPRLCQVLTLPSAGRAC